MPCADRYIREGQGKECHRSHSYFHWVLPALLQDWSFASLMQIRPYLWERLNAGQGLWPPEPEHLSGNRPIESPVT